jgi:hypothetical protein
MRVLDNVYRSLMNALLRLTQIIEVSISVNFDAKLANQGADVTSFFTSGQFYKK